MGCVSLPSSACRVCGPGHAHLGPALVLKVSPFSLDAGCPWCPSNPTQGRKHMLTAPCGSGILQILLSDHQMDQQSFYKLKYSQDPVRELTLGCRIKVPGKEQ